MQCVIACPCLLQLLPCVTLAVQLGKRSDIWQFAKRRRSNACSWTKCRTNRTCCFFAGPIQFVFCWTNHRPCCRTNSISHCSFAQLLCRSGARAMSHCIHATPRGSCREVGGRRCLTNWQQDRTSSETQRGKPCPTWLGYQSDGFDLAALVSNLRLFVASPFCQASAARRGYVPM